MRHAGSAAMRHVQFAAGSAALIIGLLGLEARADGVSTSHLQPERGVLFFPQDVVDYQLAVRKVLFPAGIPESQFIAIVQTFSQPEWPICLHSAHDGRSKVDLRVVKGLALGAALLIAEPLPAHTRYVEALDGGIAAEVAAALVRVLRKTAFPEPGSPAGYDGANYYFASVVRGEGTLAAHVWMPPDDSDAGRLVKL